jgi:uncharacterized protein YegL/serine/threonine protein phosphatase PrpC
MQEERKNALYPVYLVLDTSASMADKYDAALTFLPTLYGELMKVTNLADKLRVEVITFNEKTAVLIPLSDKHQLVKHIEKLKVNPIAPDGNGRYYGEAFSKLRTEIELGVQQLKADGYEVCHPVAFLITCGEPNDDDSDRNKSYSDLTTSSFSYRPDLICVGMRKAIKKTLEKYGAGRYKYDEYTTGNKHRAIELKPPLFASKVTPEEIANTITRELIQEIRGDCLTILDVQNQSLINLAEKDCNDQCLEEQGEFIKTDPKNTENDTTSKEWVQGLEYNSQSSIKGDGFIIGEKVGAANEIPRMAKQLNKNSHRSDWISDIAQIDDLTIMATSMRGSLHYGLETVRQDAYAIGSEVDLNGDNWLIAAIADGVSSSTRSHAIADYMVRQAILVVAESLRNSGMSFETDYWKNLNKKLIEISVEYCKNAARSIIQPSQTIDIDKIDTGIFAQQWATTLEYAIVQTKNYPDSQERKFLHISVAGDGSAYIIHKEKGWNVVKPGKKRNGGLVSNEVSALPLTPKTSSIKAGTLSTDDCLLMVTDGLGDIIQNGDTRIGGFFQNTYPPCKILPAFLYISSVALRQADDDRTVILIKEH